MIEWARMNPELLDVRDKNARVVRAGQTRDGQGPSRNSRAAPAHHVRADAAVETRPSVAEIIDEYHDKTAKTIRSKTSS